MTTSTTVLAVSPNEIATFQAAEQAWKAELADPTDQSGTVDVLAPWNDMMSITWYGVAEAPAKVLTSDLGSETGLNQHPMSIKIASDFAALAQALGLPPVTLGTLPPQPPGLVISVTGVGPASDITLDIDNQITQHTDVPLPYTFTEVTLASGGFAVVASAQDGSGASDATITCTITESGAQVATNTATGPYAIAQCNDQGGD